MAGGASSESTMDTITYKHSLRPGYSMNRFRQWLADHWPAQQRQGAFRIKYWLEDRNDEASIVCQVMVTDLKKWLRYAAKPGEWNQELADFADLRRISIEKNEIPCEHAGSKQRMKTQVTPIVRNSAKTPVRT